MLYRNRIFFVLTIIITAVYFNLQKPDYNASAGDSFFLHKNIMFHSQKSNPLPYILPNLFNFESKSRVNNLSVLFYEEKSASVTKDNFYFSFSEKYSITYRTEKAKLRAPPATV